MGLENSINSRKFASLCGVAYTGHTVSLSESNLIFVCGPTPTPWRWVNNDYIESFIRIDERMRWFEALKGHLPAPFEIVSGSNHEFISFALCVFFCFHVVSQNRHTYMTYKMPSWLYHPLLSQLFWVLEIRFENIRRPNKWRMASIEDNNIMYVESYCARNKKLLIKRCWQSIPSV